MKQERFSIRKTTRGTVSACIAVLGLMAHLGTVQVVKANDLSTPVPPVAEKQKSKDSVTPEELAVAEAELAQANQDLVVAQGEVEARLQEQEHLQSEVTSIEEALAQRPSEEEVSQAKNELTDLKEQQVTLQDKIERSTTRTSEQEALLSQELQAVSEAQATLNRHKEGAEQLTREVSQSESQLAKEALAIAEVEQEVSAAQANLEKAKQEVVDAEKALEQTSQSVEDLKAEQVNLASDRRLLAQELVPERRHLSNLKDIRDNLQKEVSTEQERLSAGVDKLVTFEVGERYFDALLRRGEFADAKYGAGSSDPILALYPQGESFVIVENEEERLAGSFAGPYKLEEYDASGKGGWMYRADYYALKGLNEHDIYRINVLLEESDKLKESLSYVSTVKDQNWEFDVNQPSDEVLLETNSFALRLIQGLAETAGLEKPALYQPMMSFVKGHMAKTLADNFRGNHYYESIDENSLVLREHAFRSANENLSQFYLRPIGNMAEMKQAIVDSLFDLLGSRRNQEWRHANGAIDLPLEESDRADSSPSAFGLGFESTSKGVVRMHWHLAYQFRSPVVQISELIGLNKLSEIESLTRPLTMDELAKLEHSKVLPEDVYNSLVQYFIDKEKNLQITPVAEETDVQKVLEDRLTAALEKLAAAEKAVTDSEEKIATLNNQLETNLKRHRELQEAIQAAELQDDPYIREQLQLSLEQARADLTRSESELSRVTDKQKKLLEQQMSQQSKVAQLTANLREAEQTVKEKSAVLAEKKAQQSLSEEQLLESRRELEALKQELSALEKTLQQAQTRYQALSDAISGQGLERLAEIREQLKQAEEALLSAQGDYQKYLSIRDEKQSCYNYLLSLNLIETPQSVLPPVTDPQPEAPKPEAPKPTTPPVTDPQPEAPKPEAPKPTTPPVTQPQPEQPKPEAPKPTDLADLSQTRNQFLALLDQSGLTDDQKGELAIRATFAETLPELAAVVARFKALTAPVPVAETKPAAKPTASSVPAPVTATATAPVAAPVSKTAGKTLPATGDKASTMALLGTGLVLASLGAIFSRRRQS